MMRSTVTVPTWVYTLTLLLLHVYIGLGSLSNPNRTSSVSLPFKIATLEQWGILFLIGSVFTLVAAMTQNKVAAVSNLIAALPLTVFGTAVLISEISSNRVGAAGLFLVPVVLHGVMAWHSWRRRDPVLA